MQLLMFLGLGHEDYVEFEVGGVCFLLAHLLVVPLFKIGYFMSKISYYAL